MCIKIDVIGEKRLNFKIQKWFWNMYALLQLRGKSDI